MKKAGFLVLLVTFCFLSCKKQELTSLEVKSPDGTIVLHCFTYNGKAFYSVKKGAVTVIDTSALGFEFAGQPALDSNFEIVKADTSSFSETWKPVWGTVAEVENTYNELKVYLRETTGSKRLLNLVFRVYNDGLGFRYEFPEEFGLKEFTISEEKTAFNFTSDNQAWWIQAHYDSYEILYNTGRLSEIAPTILNRKTRSENELYMKNDASHLAAVSTPFTMQVSDSLYVCVHEAELKNYAEMSLLVNKDRPNGFISHLTPDRNGVKVRLTAPAKTPWRTIMIVSRPHDLITSHLVENLNPPCAIEDVSWIRPVKYVGIWWGYHIGKWSWDPGNPDKEHGANTANAMRYIDFAARNRIQAVLVEGWNAKLDPATGADTSVSQMSHDLRDYSKPHPDYNFEEVVRYAKSKGVEIIVHNETMGQVMNYERQMGKAYQLYQDMGLHYIKTGYAGYIADSNAYHSSQFMVNHFQRVYELAAKHHIMICAHEPVKGTGEWRTYPNMLAREGGRGNEYNAWDKAHGNPAEHVVILPFTWLINGPMDYTPAIFDVTFDKYKKEQRVNNTLANQLALMVILYSPIQMAGDLIENYEKHPAFRFVQDVPVTYDETRVLEARIGDYVTIARRAGDAWFVGGITDENSRETSLSLDFLAPDKTWQAEIYCDAPDTDLAADPQKYLIKEEPVTSESILKLHLASGGGFAISLKPTGN